MDQYKSLLYKNWILLKRRKLETVFEWLIPVIFFILLTISRLVFSIDEIDAESYLNDARYIHPDPLGVGTYNFSKATVFGLCNIYALNGGDWIIGLSPENELTSYLSNKIINQSELASYDIVFFDSNSDLESYIKDEDYEESPKLCFAIVFEKAENNIVEYSIRYNQTQTNSDPGAIGEEIEIFNIDLYEPTDELISKPTTKFHYQFLMSGFVQIQNWVDNYILQNITGNSDALISSGFVPMYFDEWVDDVFLSNCEGLIGFFFVIVMTVPFLRMIWLIVREKEGKITQNMYIMGLSNTAYWVSWLTYYVFFYTIISLVNSLIFVLVVFTHSSFWFMFLLLMLYSFSCTALGALIATLFTNTRAAVMVGLLIYGGGYFIYYTVDDIRVSEEEKILGSLVASVALSLLAGNIVVYELAGKGITSDTFNSTVQNYKFSTGYFMIAANTAILAILAMYFDQCWPDGRGLKRPWYFLFTKAFWTKSSEDNRKFPESYQKSPNEEEYSYYDFNNSIKIRNATKKFGEYTAVNDISIDIYHGQITAILGDNGAGKTTLISLITGVLALDEGNIKIHNNFVNETGKDARKMIGMCPQYNIMYNELTVYEHLYLYSMFKGLNNNEIENEIKNILGQSSLSGKIDVLAINLSSGEKRQLNIAIALVGYSEIVILDEPTSGLDASSRRQLWSFLKNLTNSRIVIMTTHYVDEADALADRILIMNEGRISCSGSSVFLKKLYGPGYYITFFKSENASDERIQEFIKSILPQATVFNLTHSEIVYKILSAQTHDFLKAFEEIDESKDSFGIKTYIIKMTSLEDVLIKTSVKDEETPEENEKEGEEDLLLSKEKAVKSKWSDFYTLMKYRYTTSKRDYILFILEFLLPLLIVVIGTSQMMILDLVVDQDSYKEAISQYETPQDIIYYDQNTLVSDLMTLLDESSDITVTPTTEYYLDNFDKLLFEERDYDPYRMGSVYYFQMENDVYEPVIFHNQTAFQSLSTYYQAISLGILQLYDPGASITVYNHPLPVTDLMKEADYFGDTLASAIIVGLAFTFIPVAIICSVVKEETTGMKFHFHINGCSLIWYWISNILWEYLKYAIFAIIVVSLLFLFNVQIFFDPHENFTALVIVLALYGLAVILFTYCATYAFSSALSAQFITFVINLVFGTFFPVIMFILTVNENTVSLTKYAKWVLRVFPNFCIGDTLIQLAAGDIIAITNGERSAYPMYSIDRIGGIILVLCIDIFVFGQIFIFIELSSLSQSIEKLIGLDKVSAENENLTNQAREEMENSKNADPESEAILVRDVSKVYWNAFQENHEAVKHLFLDIKNGECFVLLGNNGAGKTTLFKIIAGQISATHGQVFIKGANIENDSVYDSFGYSPQLDSLNEFLTVLETLQLYAEFRSIKDKDATINKLLYKFSLRKHQHSEVGNLSEGVKRKLLVAVAVISQPPVIILDEPTTGTDPLSARLLWDILSSLKAKDTTLLITTHSMNEAETLSDRIGIMVKGELKYLESVNKLRLNNMEDIEISLKIDKISKEKVKDKIEMLEEIFGFVNKLSLEKRNDCIEALGLERDEYFGNEFIQKSLGLIMEKDGSIFVENLVTWVLQEKRGKKVVRWIKEEFGFGEIIDHYFNIYCMKVNREGLSMGSIFRKVEERYRDLKVSDYAINLPSLTNVLSKLNEEEENWKFN